MQLRFSSEWPTAESQARVAGKARVHIQLFDLCGGWWSRHAQKAYQQYIYGASEASELHKYTWRLKESTRREKTNELRWVLKVRQRGF